MAFRPLTPTFAHAQITHIPLMVQNTYRGSYMNAHVLLNLLNELEER